ncbi:MAG TPA: Rieske 2Fe-2S domain-containing protein [Chloroflexota bacterium]|nr:Rieske 2Fe-2S domain-containing protein [Chloroflexota bacterium]
MRRPVDRWADDGAEWGIVGPVAAYRDGQAHEAYVAGHPLVIVAIDGQIHALDGRCPHRHALLTEGRLEGDGVRCPLHGFRFDVRSGACLWPSGAAPVPTYDTRVEGALLLVRMAW